MMDSISHAIYWLELAATSIWRVIWSHPEPTATVISAAAAVFALLHAARSFRKSVNNAHYTELDSMYLELLKVVIDRPYLRQPDAIYKNPWVDSVHVREYDVYARMIWNFLETVADRCQDDRTLKDTWYPVIQDEGSVHRRWILEKPKGFSKNFYQRFGPDGQFGDKFLSRKI
jgi:hypothetical protein